MRASFLRLFPSAATSASLTLASVLSAGIVSAAPPEASSARKSKIVGVEPLASTKASPALVGRAVLVKELPKTLTPQDKKALDAAVHELRADHLEAGVALFRAWASGGPRPLWRDDANNAALWVFREAILTRSEQLAAAGDRVRFFDERTAAIDDAIAVVRGAAIAKKPVLVARLVLLSPYAREARGDEKRERQLSLDTFDAELKALEAKADETRSERNNARAAFAGVDEKTGRWLQALTALAKLAAEMKLSTPTRS